MNEDQQTDRKQGSMINVAIFMGALLLVLVGVTYARAGGEG